ncbi:unnamed protein product [Caenorhabditis angaria]|uniref:BZIP domain-containing protein n=1 Tax=Caenorhabditis angaria TaxID=860376 RepID=A0A9P1ILH9_9PELO|nr:unnamed protein product [Caenorhabditis angaria]
MWPPQANCNYGFAENLHEHFHHNHHHDFAHSSNNHLECFQTFSHPSDLPIESGHFPEYQDISWCSVERNCNHEGACKQNTIPEEQSKIFEEITKECQHFLKEGECDKCLVRNDDGGSETIPINDLVDIVIQTVENVGPKVEESKMLSRKRQQNKVAAARYRDKQKMKWKELNDEKSIEETRNKKLKIEVEKLEKEVAELRKQFMETISK